jgi:DNA-binding NarL/FixJ family response regulator
VRDAPKLLSQFRVAAIVVHVSAADEVAQPAEFVSALSPSPVIVLGSAGWRSSTHIERAFEAGCAAVVTEPCAPATIAAVVNRSIAGERRILWPTSLSVDAS